MQRIIHDAINKLLILIGLTETGTHPYDSWIILAVVLAVGALIYFACRMLLLRVVRQIVKRSRVQWDDILFNDRVLYRLSHIVAPILLYLLLPIAFPDSTEVMRLVMRLTSIVIIVLILRFINTFLNALFALIGQREQWQGKPLNGLKQTFQVIAILLGTLSIISILINRSPTILLTGLGAFAAVLMLIFKDSILGLVSGIQLSANNMLKVGDWISMPKYDVDGSVEEVSLTTVKVRGWDNTVTTVPPYLLVSDSVQNWQAMRDTGGRRVKRSIHIDIDSIARCSPEQLNRLRRIDYLAARIAEGEAEVADERKRRGLSEEAITGRELTNIGLFRRYLIDLLHHDDRVNQRMIILVRQLQPEPTGLPLELYFFTRTVDWIPYEGVQADLFDHVFTMAKEFGLRIYQTPAASDLREAMKSPK